MSARRRNGTPWKVIAMALAIALCAVLVFAALLISGVMRLGFSLL